MQDFDLVKRQLLVDVRVLLQMWRIMKITVVILLCACLQICARGYTQQPVTLDLKQATLVEAFRQIRQQTGYNFFYQSEWLKKAHRVSIRVRDVPLAQALDSCFKEQPVTYSITGTSIVLTPRAASVGPVQNMNIPPVDIKGRVISMQTEPLAGASVIVLESGKGTQTDAEGFFTLRNVEPTQHLLISYAGYQPQKVLIGSRTSFLFRLEVATSELDQLIVQAYGQTTQRFGTGNIVKIKAEEIARQPVMNPLQALQGRVAGLSVSQVNGYASAPFKVEIRGRNAIGPDQLGLPADPLYIIDGVPLTILEVGNNSTYTSGSRGLIQNDLYGPAGGQSPLFSINPADIESIEVLKDADATAIYGSRAANGVILITTKKGKTSEKAKLEVSVHQGMNMVTRRYAMLNTPQYLAMRREAFANNNRTMTAGTAPDVLVWDSTRYTDWQDLAWGNAGKNTNVQMAFSGGSQQTSFRLAAGYNRMTDILAVSGGHQRANVSAHVNYFSQDRRLNVALAAGYSFVQADMISFPFNAVTLPPNAPPIYDAAGQLNYEGWTPLRASFPFSSLLSPYQSSTHFLNSSLSIGYQLAKGLTVRSSLGYNNSHVSQQSFLPIAAQDLLNNPTGTASFGNNFNRNWVIEPQVDYSRRMGRGSLNVLVGGSVQQTTTEGLAAFGSGYTSDALLHTISIAPVQSNRNNQGLYRYAALFGRLNYNWGNKYIVTLSARRDGSSYFGPDHQFGNFGSIGAAWLFTEENWFKEWLSFVSFGKLRASYGTTGGDGQPYKYLTRWMPANDPGYPYAGVPPLSPTQHANPDYHWQVNRKLEVALQLGFWKDRVNLSAAFYRNKVDNQLTAYPIPVFTGFPDVFANSPAVVENKGWEFTVAANPVDRASFKWSVTGNVSFNKNKLLAFPHLELSPYRNVLIVGQSLNILKLLEYTGVDPQTGLYTYTDRNKDGVINTNTAVSDTTSDLYYYDRSPAIMGGLGNTITYKGWAFSFFFNFTQQTGRNALAGLIPGTLQNAPVSVLKRWQQPGDVTGVARFTTIQDPSDSYFGRSTGAYTDASFLRLQNVSLSWSLPKRWFQRVQVSAIALYLQAQNLFVITGYEGIDPETQNFGGMPPARIMTGGIHITL